MFQGVGGMGDGERTQKEIESEVICFLIWKLLNTSFDERGIDRVFWWFWAISY